MSGTSMFYCFVFVIIVLLIVLTSNTSRCEQRSGWEGFELVNDEITMIKGLNNPVVRVEGTKQIAIDKRFRDATWINGTIIITHQLFNVTNSTIHVGNLDLKREGDDIILGNEQRGYFDRNALCVQSREHINLKQLMFYIAFYFH